MCLTFPIPVRPQRPLQAELSVWTRIFKSIPRSYAVDCIARPSAPPLTAA